MPDIFYNFANLYLFIHVLQNNSEFYIYYKRYIIQKRKAMKNLEKVKFASVKPNEFIFLSKQHVF